MSARRRWSKGRWLLLALSGIAACLAFGFAGTWLALGERASKRLRNE